MFRSYDHHQGLLLCLCKILLNGVHASLYFGVWPYVIWALYVWCVPFGTHHTYNAQITDGHTPKYNEACTPLSKILHKHSNNR
jgi:hypothetical protein